VKEHAIEIARPDYWFVWFRAFIALFAGMSILTILTLLWSKIAAAVSDRTRAPYLNLAGWMLIAAATGATLAVGVAWLLANGGPK